MEELNLNKIAQSLLVSSSPKPSHAKPRTLRFPVEFSEVRSGDQAVPRIRLQVTESYSNLEKLELHFIFKQTMDLREMVRHAFEESEHWHKKNETSLTERSLGVNGEPCPEKKWAKPIGETRKCGVHSTWLNPYLLLRGCMDCEKLYWRGCVPCT